MHYLRADMRFGGELQLHARGANHKPSLPCLCPLLGYLERVQMGKSAEHHDHEALHTVERAGGVRAGRASSR